MKKKLLFLFLISFPLIANSLFANSGENPLPHPKNPEISFKSCGLDKLTRVERKNLMNWLEGEITNFSELKSQNALRAPSGAQFPRDFERAKILSVDSSKDQVVVIRLKHFDEVWLLEAKGALPSWVEEYAEKEKEVLLEFNFVSSVLTNDKGETCRFWTLEELPESSRNPQR